jgi:Fic family protein
LQKIDELATVLKGLLPMKPEDQQRLDKKFRLEFNYNSNHIEGNTLTYGETELLLYRDHTNGIHTLREYEEMKAHDLAYFLIQDWAKEKERPLTESDIKELNKTILKEPFWKEAKNYEGKPSRKLIKIGEYKDSPNSVELPNGEMFEYASPTDTPILMGEMMDWYRKEIQKGELHPAVLAAFLHYKFVRIHPFDDGNGRVSRLLMNYVLLQNNFPPVIVKSLDKKNYIGALNSADAGDLEAFFEYISKQLVWSLELSIKAAKGESIEEPDDLDKQIELLNRKLVTKDEIKKKKSREVIQETFTNSIEPLLKTIEERLGKFDQFFFEKEHTNINDIFLVASDGGTKYEEMFGVHMNGFSINYTWKGFKKGGVKTFQIGFVMDIDFNDFTYSVLGAGIEKPRYKTYSESFTEEECKTIANEIGKHVLEEIERMLSSEQ